MRPMNRSRFVVRVVVAVAACILVIEVLYLVGANAFLATRVPLRRINARPEMALVEWDEAWTWAPGVVHLTGVRVRGQSRRVQWYATAGRMRVSVRLLPLLFRHFHARSVHGRSVTFDLRRRLDAIERPARHVGAWPPIPGLANPPEAAPERIYPGRRGRPWTITIDGSRLEQVHRIWLEEHRIVGEGVAEGRLRAEIHGSVRLDRVALRMLARSVTIGDRAVAEDLDIDAETSIAPFEAREAKVRGFWRKVSGHLGLRGAVSSLAFVNFYLERAPWVRLDGSGTLDADLVLRSGELQPGSRISADAETIAANVLGHEVRGTGTLRGSVSAGPHPEGNLGVELAEFSIHRGHDEPAYARGTRFRVEARSHGTDLATGFTDVDLAFDVPASRVARFEVFGAYLPLGRGFRLEGGDGEIVGHVEVSTAEGTGEGSVELTGRRIRASFEELPLVGDVVVRLDLGRLASEGRPGTAPVFALRHARVDLSRLTAGTRRRPPWWGVVDLREGRLGVQPFRLDARLDARLKDTAPIVAIFAERKLLVSLFRSLLMVENVEARASLGLAERSLTIGDFVLSGERTELLGDIHFTEASQDGLLFARLGSLTAAVEMNPDGRRWKLVQARRWFEARRAERRAGGSTSR